MPPRAKKESDEPVRRSSRNKGLPLEDAPEPKPKAAPKKRTKAEDAVDGDDEEKEAPSAKKKAKTEESTFNIGDVLPEITVQNEKGEDVEVNSLAAEKGVVIFLIPKADTPGCTTQACGFRDSYPDFTAVNYDVYCLSADSPAAQTKWQTKKELPYPLLSDPKRVLISALGAGTDKSTKRSHFIFEKGGKLVDKKVPVKPKDSPSLALEFIKSLEASS